ncbi:MAG: dihydroxyacetone kinase subunit DhaK, partial [Chloroflexota bacterium]
MTTILNNAENFREEMIEGFVAAYNRHVQRIPDASGVMINGGPVAGKVSVLIGGGSGHYPAFCGMVGPGFATGSVIGDIFTSPSGEQVYRCTKALDGGAGVIYSYGNYSGDVMNFAMGEMRAEAEGIDVRQVIVTDDVASSETFEDRRGVAGDFHVFKALSSSAWRGDDLDTVEAMGQRANAMTRTFGIAFGGCTLPGKSEPMFTVDPGMMEVGMGIHGEPGIQTTELIPASDLAKMMVDKILANAPDNATDKVTVMVNGLGSTHYEEMFVYYGTVSKLLANAGLQVHDPLIGEFATSLDMEGFSLTLM